MDELHQYDSADRDDCDYGGPMMIDRRRRKRSFCGRWYWPSFPGGGSSKEVFNVSSFCEASLNSLQPDLFSV